MEYGYARCSTKKQSIDSQLKYLIDVGIPQENVYWEYVSAYREQVELNKLLSIMNPGDSLTVVEVSRIARDSIKLHEVLNIIQKRRLRLVVGEIEIDCRDGEVPNTAPIMASALHAQVERSVISQRAKRGIAEAKERGVVVGRPKTDIDSLPKNFFKLYKKWKDGYIRKVEFATLLNVSRPTLDKYIRIYER